MLKNMIHRFLWLQWFAFVCAISLNAQTIGFSLSATVSDSNKVKLAWSAPREVTVAKYFIYRAQLGADQRVDPAKFVLRDSTSSTEYLDVIPDLKTQGYAYVVRARTSKGEFSSNVAVVSIVPQAGLKLVASVGSERVVTLTATPVNFSTGKLYFYRGVLAELGGALSPTQMTLIDSVQLPAHEVRDTTARRASALYGYIAKAQIGTRTIESNLATANLITTPIKISLELKVSADDSSRPRLTWGYSGPTVAMFYIYAASFSDPGMMMNPVQLQKIDSTTQTSYTYRGVLPSSGFIAFRVIAKTVAGTNVESNVATFYLSKKIKLSAYVDLEGNVKLNWTSIYDVMANPLAVWYKIYRAAVIEGSTGPSSFTFVDSTRANEWKERPSIPNVRSLSYYVEATVGGRISRSDTATVFWKTPPPAPFFLTGKLGEGGKVSLSWNQPSGFTPAKYYLYRAMMVRNSTKFDSTAQFALVDSTTNKEIINAPPFDLSNVFAYYVEARGGTNKARTNTLLVILPPTPSTDQLTIVSDPPRSARVRILYTYQPKAKSSDPTATLKWSLTDKPSGMAIDSATGLIQWTPSVKGRFGVRLWVVSNKGGRASQEYYISVAGLAGIVQGTVTDTAGTPLKAIVKLLKRDATAALDYSTQTDSAGFFQFKEVDAGSYLGYAMALRGDYIPQWYYQKSSPDQATPINVAESTTVTISFSLKSRATSTPKYSISGFVSDSVGKPIAGASVLFSRVEFMLNSSKNGGSSTQQSENYRDFFNANAANGLSNDNRLDGNSESAFKATTDANGKYSITAPAGAYIGMAYAQGYRKVFYNGKTDLLSADVLKLTKDTTKIDFTLLPLPSITLGSISGSVLDSSSRAGVASRIIVYRDKKDRGPQDAFFADSDTTGKYTVSDLPPGDYYVLAMPLGHYAPSFYSVGGPTTKWKEATKVTINGTAISGIDIYVLSMRKSSNGYATVQGSVTTRTGANKLSGGFAKTGVAEGVNGTIVYAVDNSGTVASYSITDADGAYTIPSLAPQTYTIYTDRIGFETSTPTYVSPTYDDMGNAQPATASFDLSQTATGIDDQDVVVPQEYSLAQNYPNPFNPSTKISFNLPAAERISLVVYNILGQKVATIFEGDLQAGNHTVNWNAKSDNGVALSTGVYFYQLKASQFVATKKMVLLK